MKVLEALVVVGVFATAVGGLIWKLVEEQKSLDQVVEDSARRARELSSRPFASMSIFRRPIIKVDWKREGF